MQSVRGHHQDQTAEIVRLQAEVDAECDITDGVLESWHAAEERAEAAEKRANRAEQALRTWWGEGARPFGSWLLRDVENILARPTEEGEG